METNKWLSIIIGKYLAKVRWYTKIPQWYSLGSLLDLWWEATKKELIDVCNKIIEAKNDKIEELEKQIKPVEQKEFKDFILDELDERFCMERNEAKNNIMWCWLDFDMIKIKATWFWEKSNWYEYNIIIWDKEFNWTKEF